MLAAAAEADLQHSHPPVHKLHQGADRFPHDQHVGTSFYIFMLDRLLVDRLPLCFPPQPVSERGRGHAVPRRHGQPVSRPPVCAESHQVSGQFC